MVISHQEYIGDIIGSTNFKMQLAHGINPSNFKLFPWLSEIAQRFEEYEFKKLKFIFKTMSSDTVFSTTSTALGTVMMGTEYDSLDANFETKEQMLNHQYSRSCKPSQSMIHHVICSRKQNFKTHLFTRDFTVLPTEANQSGDPRLYDMGVFQIATQGMLSAVADATIGELWVKYTICLYKPQIPEGNDTNNQQRLQGRHVINFTFEGQKPLAPFLLSSGSYGAYSGKAPIIRINPDGKTLEFTTWAKSGIYFVAIRYQWVNDSILEYDLPGRIVFTDGNQVEPYEAFQMFDTSGSSVITTRDQVNAPQNIVVSASDLTSNYMVYNFCLKLVKDGSGTVPSIAIRVPNKNAKTSAAAFVSCVFSTGVHSLFIFPLDSSLANPANLISPPPI